MANVQDLYKQLIELPRRQYSDLIRQVDRERRQAVEQEERAHPPAADMNRAEFARWVARQHFAVDKGITRIFYLPEAAPEEEVRLLEVNELAHIPEDAPIVAVDFAPDIEGVHFRLFVADVTPGQFEHVQANRVELPAGWNFEGAEELPAGDR